MRIIPHELLIYTPNMSLTALRKELGMYDFSLNKAKSNIAMQAFLDLGRNYFNLIVNVWVKEMLNRGFYVNSLFICYVKHNSYQDVRTDIYLIVECCLQWELKNFSPFNCEKRWFDIITVFLTQREINFKNWNMVVYQAILTWYYAKFMKLNLKGKAKPKNLNIKQVIDYLKTALN